MISVCQHIVQHVNVLASGVFLMLATVTRPTATFASPSEVYRSTFKKTGYFSRSAIIVHERGWTCDPLGVVAESVLDFGFPIHVLLARGITVALDSWLKRDNCLAQLTNYHSRWHTIQERIDRAHTSYSLSWSSNYELVYDSRLAGRCRHYLCHLAFIDLSK